MRAVVQRVKRAAVRSQEHGTQRIDKGLCVFMAVRPEDTPKDLEYIAGKLSGLRIFPDENGKMNLSAAEVGAQLLVVSQFTLYGDCRKGRRPGFSAGGNVQEAEAVYNRFIALLNEGPLPLKTGWFGADMEVDIVNDGPVTLLLDSTRLF